MFFSCLPVYHDRHALYGLPTSSTKRLPDIVGKRTKRTVHFSSGNVLISVKGVSRHASIVLRRSRQFTVALAPTSRVEPEPIGSGPGHVAQLGKQMDHPSPVGAS